MHVGCTGSVLCMVQEVCTIWRIKVVQEVCSTWRCCIEGVLYGSRQFYRKCALYGEGCIESLLYIETVIQ